jgi:hypothetical protein
VSRWRKIDAKFWLDEKVRDLSERGKLVCLFTMTHPQQTMLGGMRATEPGLAAELDIELEAFREAFGEVLSKGISRYDRKASLVWFPNYLKYNRPESPNVVRAWPQAFDLLPECALKCEIFQCIKAFTEGMSEAFQIAFREAFAKTLPNQEQEQYINTLPNADASSGVPPFQFALAPATTKHVASDLDAFLDGWNSCRGPLSAISMLSKTRREKLKSRIAEGLTLDEFKVLVQKCASTPFLRGEGKDGWKATFDWLIANEGNSLKVAEGNYQGAVLAPTVGSVSATEKLRLERANA